MTQTRLSIASGLLVCMAMVACRSASNGPTPSATASNALSATSCGTPIETVGEYMFSGGLGIQSGVQVGLRANQPPLKVTWANRSAQPPREMTIRVVAQGQPAVTMSAGWAATQAQPSFPTSGPVTGYVSEIPTLPAAGCWEFSWTEGSAADKLTLRAAP